jgi:TP901 family phage tail tape measure protein
MNYSTTWTLSLSDKMSAPLNIINEKGKKTATAVGDSLVHVGKKLDEATKKATVFGDCLKRIKPIDWQAVGNSIDQISNRLNEVADVGAKFDVGLRDVSAITGITGTELDKLGTKARGLSKDFGSTATDNLQTFQTILSRLGPEIGQSQEALGNMGKYANTLSKTMGGDVVGATDALTTSMLQFKVNLDDPIAAAKEMERMMNVMAAGAKEGASEVPQISEALVQAGGVAKLANVSFEETNSALQALAQSGKYGSEAGVGLRNVLIKMNAPSALSKEASETLKKYGVNMKLVSDASLPLADRLKELQKIGTNTDALAAVFGAENIQAAQGLIQSAQYQEELTQKITGTNVAYVQAETVMGGWTEKMKRAKAWVDDLKIGSFAFTSVLSAGFSTLSTTATLITDLSTVYSGLAPVMKSAVTWLRGTALWQGIVSISTKAYTAAQWLLNAALTANPIGLIVVAIAALIAVVVVAIKYYDQWGAALMLFLGPIGMVINAFKSIYDHWESIKKAFQTEGIIGGLKRLGWVLLDALLKPFQQILEIVDKVAGTNWSETIRKVRQAQNLVTEGEAGKPRFVNAGTEEVKVHNAKIAAANKKPATTSAADFIGGAAKPATDKKGKASAKEKDGLSMSGSGGGTKNITMTINITNNFSVAKGIGNLQNIANQVTGAINDRLRDGLVMID